MPTLYDRAIIETILPHRPPFLFVDRVMALKPGERLEAERDLRPDEPHFAGHFPGRPLMPGVLVTEAMAQASGLLLALSGREGRPILPGPPGTIVLAAAQVKFVRPAVPGETLTLTAGFERSLGALYHFSVAAAVGRRAVASGTLVLAEWKESP
jgi:3-hydroxyacyl-[acyl-carrier-protein] dehydratase